MAPSDSRFERGRGLRWWWWWKEDSPLRLAFRAREGAERVVVVEKMYSPPPTRVSGEGGAGSSLSSLPVLVLVLVVVVVVAVVYL
jgi:hypothetical protein